MVHRRLAMAATPGVVRPVCARIVLAAALGFYSLANQPGTFAQGTGDHWVGTWATAAYAPPPLRAAPQNQARQALPSSFNNQTLRQVVHTSIGGERVRVVLSNVFGTAPLAVGAVHIALRQKNAAIVSTSDRAVTFGGSPSTTIPARAIVVSDPASLTVPPLADLVVDIYLPGEVDTTTSPFTIHDVALQTNYVSLAGNHAGAVDLPVMTTTQSWFFLSRVEIAAPQQAGAVVAIGDSITNGTVSTPDTNQRWPDQLARRLAAGKVKMGMLNAAIDGNRLLSDGNNGSMSALARFDRDVLVQTGVTHVIVLEGVNDLRNVSSTTAADLIAGHRQLVERAHARGLKIFGGTLTPSEGSGGWTPDHEAKRQALNEWIRSSKVYDGVIDFDAAMRDPNHQTLFLPAYDSGGHLHPNDAGYRAMGAAINLGLFTDGQRTTRVSRR